MDYQNLLKLPYVISLIYSLVNKSQCVLDSSNIIKIVNLDNKYYIKDSKENLYLIKDGMERKHTNVKMILDTCILFEETKEYSINTYIEAHTNNLRGKYNYVLLQALQIQYSTNKLYFNISFLLNP